MKPVLLDEAHAADQQGVVAIDGAADQVTCGKPDPEGYLRAASALGVVDPGRCVVLEDAPARVAAGLAAGMHVIAVLRSHGEAELAGAQGFVGDLRDVPAIAARLVD